MRYLFASRGVVTVLALITTACSTPNARDVWTKVLSNCSCSDTLPAGALFLGLSNQVGPGSVWRLSDDGVYCLRFTLNDAKVPPDEMIAVGNPATCGGSVSQALQIAPELALASASNAVSGAMLADLRSAQIVSVTIDTWRLDRLKELPYEEWANSPKSASHGVDIARPGRFVATQAVWVSGLKARLSVQDAFALESGIKSSAALGNLNANAINQQTLDINSREPFYITLVLAPVRERRSLGMHSPETTVYVASREPVVVKPNATTRIDDQ